MQDEDEREKRLREVGDGLMLGAVSAVIIGGSARLSGLEWGWIVEILGYLFGLMAFGVVERGRSTTDDDDRD